MTTVHLTEVGPRDGLQNEKGLIPTEAKIAFVDALTDAGHRQIEVSSFVRPDRVPAMADAEAVFNGIRRAPGVRYMGLVANQRGLDRAQAVNCDTIAVFTAASSSFTRANVSMTVEESLSRYRPLVAQAGSARGYVSTIFECPFEGPTEPHKVIAVAEQLLEMGCYEVSLGDTTGVGKPGQVRRLLDEVVPALGTDKVALHLHDTWGMAVANAMVGLEYGIRRFDASAGGLGGCPFAPGASGNLATEDLLYCLAGEGIDAGVNLQKIAEAATALAGFLDHPLYSRVNQGMMSRAPGRSATIC